MQFPVHATCWLIVSIAAISNGQDFLCADQQVRAKSECARTQERLSYRCTHIDRQKYNNEHIKSDLATEHLYCDHCDWDKIDYPKFEYWKNNLKHISLTNCKGAKEITAIAFNAPQTTLEHIHVQNCGVDRLEPSVLSKLFRLRVLSVPFNTLSELPRDLFKYNEQLRELMLNNNAFKQIDAPLFAPLKNLQKLVVSNNKFTHIPMDAFTALTNLEELDISNNPIYDVNIANVLALPRLKRLDFLNWPCDTISKQVLLDIADTHTIHNNHEGYYLVDTAKGAVHGVMPRIQIWTAGYWDLTKKTVWPKRFHEGILCVDVYNEQFFNQYEHSKRVTEIFTADVLDDRTQRLAEVERSLDRVMQYVRVSKKPHLYETRDGVHDDMDRLNVIVKELRAHASNMMDLENVS